MVDLTTVSSEAACAASFLPWIEAFLVPTVIVCTAFIAYRVQISVQAKRTAYDYIINYEWNDEWRKLSTEAIGHLTSKTSKDDWTYIALDWSRAKLSDKDSDMVATIREYLNRREFLSICLLDKSMDQSIYARWWGILLIEEWQKAEHFIEAFRSTEKGDDDIFSHFEKLANSEDFRRLSKWDELKKGGIYSPP